MKNLIYAVIVFLVLFASQENAQVSVGFLGGVNFGDLKSEENNIESKSFLGIGGLIEYNLGDNFSLVAEPMYLQKGGVQPESNTQPEIRINLSFIELPLLLKYKFNFSESIKPYLVAGPTAGYRLSAKMNADINMIAFSGDLENVSQAFDFGVTMGAGIEIPLESIFIFLEGRYSFGLIDIHKNGTFEATGGGMTMRETFTDENWFKTKGVQIMTGIKFPLGS